MELKLIDFEVALERLGDDEEFLMEMLDELILQLGETIQNLEEAIHKSDFQNVRSLAHGMKGATSNLGADRIADYLLEMEKKGADQALDGSEELLEKIKTTFEEMKIEVEKH